MDLGRLADRQLLNRFADRQLLRPFASFIVGDEVTSLSMKLRSPLCHELCLWAIEPRASVLESAGFSPAFEQPEQFMASMHALKKETQLSMNRPNLPLPLSLPLESQI